MSIKLMSEAWSTPLPAMQKLVLLALADCANDEGLAWPSVATIAKKSGCNERTVQRNLRALEDAGLIVREEVLGKGCRYWFGSPKKPNPRSASKVIEADKPMGGNNPEQNHYVYRIECPATGEYYIGARSCLCEPVEDLYMGSGAWVKQQIDAGVLLHKTILASYDSREELGAGEAEHVAANIGEALCANRRLTNANSLAPHTPVTVPPRQKVRAAQTPKTPGRKSPKPSRTIICFSNEKHTREDGWIEIPAWVPVEPWNAYLKMRQRIGKWPTDDAVKLIVGKLERWRASGHDPGGILDASTESNWTGIFEPKVKAHGRTAPSNRNTAELALAKLGMAGG